MRYQDWDVLVFPEESKIPVQEFKTSCQVIQDPEPHNLQLTGHLLPTVTSFIPGLAAGAGFRVSIHSWRNPISSRYIETLKKSTDTIIFEARLFVDGRLAGSKWFDTAGPWPSIIELSIDLDKTGEFEKLKFPTFHRELLSQSHWNPGDDLGRVKVIIAEGFSRDSASYPFERIKNIVSFSFQHAPLEVLEQSSIAWPNAIMWRQVAIVSPYYSQQVSPRRQEDALEAHGHSPRHVAPTFKPPVPSNMGFMGPPSINPRQSNSDPFVDARGPAFNGWRQASSDVSMPDYSSSSAHTSVRNVSDPMNISEKGERNNFQTLQTAGAYDQLCEALIPSAPANTPRNAATPMTATPMGATPMGATPMVAPATRVSSAKSEPLIPNNVKMDIAAKNAAQLQQAFSEIRSRKENNPGGRSEADTSFSENSARFASQSARAPPPFSSNGNIGTKRPRVMTPAANKVIDDEDEPGRSPTTMRKASRASAKPDGRENDKRVLSHIENV